MGKKDVETSVLSSEEASELISALSKITKRKKGTQEITTEVVKSKDTRQIIVPDGMDLLEASKELKAQYDNLEQVVDVTHVFEGYDWKDGLVAVKKVSEAMFGWMKGITETDMWGNEYRPQEIDVTVNVIGGKAITEKCFYGKFSIAAWSRAEASVDIVGNGEVYIAIKSKKKYSEDVSKYFAAIRQYLEANSIYRGKTVVVTDQGKNFVSFNFEIIENKPADLIILNENENLVLEEFIIGDIGEPGKKCYLFTGPYGNGKTETAMMIGRKANELGIPFFYVKDAKLFDQVLNRCKKYQPCIIFLEDVDEIGAGDQRDDKMNRILNTLDGVQTKGNSLTVIFTTNHERRINPALRRPGRIDIVVNFTNPDAKTKEQIYRRYFEALGGAENVNYEAVVDATQDVSGSVVAQIAKRAVKLAIKRGGITTNIAKSAVVSMEYHIRLMSDEVEGEPLQLRVIRELSELLVGKRIDKLEENVRSLCNRLSVQVAK